MRRAIPYNSDRICRSSRARRRSRSSIRGCSRHTTAQISVWLLASPEACLSTSSEQVVALLYAHISILRSLHGEVVAVDQSHGFAECREDDDDLDTPLSALDPTAMTPHPPQKFYDL